MGLLSLSLISCNSDDNSNTATEDDSAGFYALSEGNQWTYQYYSRITMTDEFELVDCSTIVEITGTSQINNETYFTVETTTTGSDAGSIPCDKNPSGTIRVRDSLGFLIDSDGAILYSRENTAPYLISENTWGDIYGELLLTSETIEVPAGTFDCLKLERFAILNDGSMSIGRENEYWSDGIGEVYETYSLVSASDHRWEKRLVSYDLASTN